MTYGTDGMALRRGMRLGRCRLIWQAPTPTPCADQESFRCVVLGCLASQEYAQEGGGSGGREGSDAAEGEPTDDDNYW